MKTIIAFIFFVIYSSFISYVYAAEHHENKSAYLSHGDPIKITDDIYLIGGNGGNIAVNIGPDGMLIVDNGVAGNADRLKLQLTKLGGKNTLKYIINTHWHDDHSGANNKLGHRAVIVAHDNVRKHLSKKHGVKLFDLSADAFEPQGLPTITYPEQTNIHFNGHTIELVYFAGGHSDSDSMVYFREANVLHMGDLMVYPMLPFIDYDSGGDALRYAENIAKILKLIDDSTIVIPGHGQVTDKEGMMEFHTMLTGTIAEITAMHSRGMSLDEVQKKGLSPHWEKWSYSAITPKIWIDEIYFALEKKAEH